MIHDEATEPHILVIELVIAPSPSVVLGTLILEEVDHMPRSISPPAHLDIVFLSNLLHVRPVCFIVFVACLQPGLILEVVPLPDL